MKPCSIWIGFDAREAAAFAVARNSLRSHLTQPIPTHGLVLDRLKREGLFTRRQDRQKNRDGQLWDAISDAPCSTEFSISRFLVPYLAAGRQGWDGWALFMDCDVLVRKNIGRLFDQADDSKAVLVVKHDHDPDPADRFKMDGQLQTRYGRKNWSSVMLFNLSHPSTRKLTVDLANSAPGRDLHQFCWLKDQEIGDIAPAWNWLAGHSPKDIEPAIVHYTDGVPSMPGYENAPYADEWRASLERWAI